MAPSLLSAALIALLGTPTYPTHAAYADTPAQAQKAIQAACNRAAVSYARRDLSGFMGMYSPGYVSRTVTGRRGNFRQLQAGIARAFARENDSATARCVVSQVSAQGGVEGAVVRWHFVTRIGRTASAPAYTLVRDYEEQSVWNKSGGGWRQTSADMTRDTLTYRR